MNDQMRASELEANGANQPARIADPYPQPAIDLPMLLMRNYWWMIIAGLLGALVGIVYAFSTPRVYAFSSIIEVGRADAIVENPETTVAKVANGYGLQVEQEFRATVEGSPATFDLEAKNPHGTNLVIITSRGNGEQQAVHLELHKKILELVAADHHRMLGVVRKALEVELGKAERDGEAIKDRTRALTLERSLVEESRKLLTEEKGAISGLLLAIRASREVAGKMVDGQAQALTLMMIDSQSLTNQERLFRLEERLNVDLVQQAERASQSLTENARTALWQEDKINELKIRINDIQETKMLIPPMRLLKPVGMGRATLAILGMFIGLCMGAFWVWLQEVRRLSDGKASIPAII